MIKFLLTDVELTRRTPLEVVRLACDRLMEAYGRDWRVDHFTETKSFGGGFFYEVQLTKKEKQNDGQYK